jgi:hypothetical protein
MKANAIGGSVNFISELHLKEAMLNASIGGGYNQKAGKVLITDLLLVLGKDSLKRN